MTKSGFSWIFAPNNSYLNIIHKSALGHAWNDFWSPHETKNVHHVRKLFRLFSFLLTLFAPSLMKSEAARVSRFFIFNPVKFGLREENDTEKLLYFWPHELPLDKKMVDVGLVEALTNFCEYGSIMKWNYLFHK